MSSTQDVNKNLVVRFNKEFVEGQNDSVYREIVAEGFVDRSGPPGGPTPFLFFTKVFRPAFPDAKVVIHDLVAEGDKVVAYKSYEGTHKGEFMGIPATGKRISFKVMEIIRLQDGKYIDHWAVADAMGLVHQLKSDSVAAPTEKPRP